MLQTPQSRQRYMCVLYSRPEIMEVLTYLIKTVLRKRKSGQQHRLEAVILNYQEDKFKLRGFKLPCSEVSMQFKFK